MILSNYNFTDRVCAFYVVFSVDTSSKLLSLREDSITCKNQVQNLCSRVQAQQELMDKVLHQTHTALEQQRILLSTQHSIIQVIIIQVIIIHVIIIQVIMIQVIMIQVIGRECLCECYLYQSLFKHCD